MIEISIEEVNPIVIEKHELEYGDVSDIKNFFTDLLCTVKNPIEGTERLFSTD